MERAGTSVGRFGHHVRWFPHVASTNDVAAAWAEHGAPEGAVVIADTQTAGRGRHGRVWASPSDAGVYLSVVLRPAADTLPLLTITGGVAVADAIKSATGLETVLKWPNDVYAGARKLAGLLAESAGTADTVVLGIGINVMPAAYPPDIASRATSLETELGRPVDRGLLFAELLCALEARYASLAARHTDGIVDAWRRRAAPMLGRPVQWAGGGRTVSGIAADIDSAGALLIRTPAGIERIMSGEVLWNPEHERGTRNLEP